MEPYTFVVNADNNGQMPENVRTDEQLAKAKNLRYTAIPISDHDIDTSLQDAKTIDRIVSALLKGFQESDMIYVHCKGGKSRSPAVVDLAIILLDAKHKPFQEIKTDLKAHKFESKKIKHFPEFFQYFHQYVAESDPKVVSWSEWATKMGVIDKLNIKSPKDK